MSPTFTDDDVGKTVESADGEALGAIVAVDEETAYVEPKPGVTDSVKAVLEWMRESEGAVPLADDAVNRVTDDAVRLDTGFPEESVTTGQTDEDDRSADSERGEIGYAPGESVESATTDVESEIDGTDRVAGTGELDEPESDTDDEYYDTPEGGPRVDPDETMDEPAERPDERASTDESERSDSRDRATETESVEAEAGRELEVDPTELTDSDPNAELSPDEDVGTRTDAEVDPGVERRSDAEVEPGSIDSQREDAAGEPDRVDSEVGGGAGVEADEEDDSE